MADPSTSSMNHMVNQPNIMSEVQSMNEIEFCDVESSLTPQLSARHVTLRHDINAASIVPIASQRQVPRSLLSFLTDQLNSVIDAGDTYPYTETMTVDSFGELWFQKFAAIMLLGNISSSDQLNEDMDWSNECLGTFYIKPNYPGRSSHICKGEFLVIPSARGLGVERLMGEAFVIWAPKLGYLYSVFNLVYETNYISCQVWDDLGFERIGRIKSAGSLKSHPDRMVDAIIFGRDLLSEKENLLTEDRFEKIKFYLKYKRYPIGSNRQEKTRLRKAATCYKLDPATGRLMINDKEVVSSPQLQYEIACNVHKQHHTGITRTTTVIAEKYHWPRIKDIVIQVVRNCENCNLHGQAEDFHSEEVADPDPSDSLEAAPVCTPSESGSEGEIGRHSPTVSEDQAQTQTTPVSRHVFTPLRHPDIPDPRYCSPQLQNHLLSPDTMSADHLHPHLHQTQTHNYEPDHSDPNYPAFSESPTYMQLDPRIIESILLGDCSQSGYSSAPEHAPSYPGDSTFSGGEDVIGIPDLDEWCSLLDQQHRLDGAGNMELQSNMQLQSGMQLESGMNNIDQGYLDMGHVDLSHVDLGNIDFSNIDVENLELELDLELLSKELGTCDERMEAMC